MTRECNCVVLRHNSQGLQNKLEALGYIPLKWTVSLQPNQLLIASSYEYTVRGWTNSFYEKIPDKTYKNSFWNGGVAPPQDWSNCIDVGDDEDLFLKYAEMLTKQKYLYFEGNVQVDKPSYL
jgi:hypothetical protein